MAAAVSLALAAAFIALIYPLVDRGSLAEPFFEVDEAEGKAQLDSHVVLEIRGSFSEEEIRESLQIHPPVLIGEQDLAVEDIAKFPWHEGFPWAKTRVTINPHKSQLFEPETSYTLVLKEQSLALETITGRRAFVIAGLIEVSVGNRHNFYSPPTVRASLMVSPFHWGV